MRFVVRSAVMVAGALGTVVPAAPASAGPPLDLGRLPIIYQADGPDLEGGYWIPGPRAGEWRITGGGLGADDRLTLEVEIRPAPLSVPLEPGPAVLFGAVSLAGDAGGDMGINADVERVVARVLPACDPADCVHRATITLPTHVLPRLARATDARSWMAAEISLSLVRTFAQGTWVQHLGLYDETHELGENGTLGRPATFADTLASAGAMPVTQVVVRSKRSRPTLERVERLRRTLEDPSRRPETAPLLVDIATSHCTGGYSIVTATGDTVLDDRRLGTSAHVRVEVPVGADWMVYVPSLWWSPARESLAFGPFAADGPVAATGWVSGDGWDEQCPVGGHVSWREITPEEVTLPPVWRCWNPDGRWLTWRPGTLGRCME